MKKILARIFLSVVIIFSVSSCFSLQYDVGEGAQNGIETNGKSHYFIFGLAKGATTTPTALAGDANDYSVTIEHTFVDGLLRALTFGIYTPTTTTVIKE